jgi:hypothetical protein
MYIEHEELVCSLQFVDALESFESKRHRHRHDTIII